jgi:hypothetical protein
MRKIIIALIAATLATASSALAADTASLAWSQSNIQTLRSLDKAGIFRLITGEHADRMFTEKNIWEFGWYDLAGDGNYELVYTGATGPCCIWLRVVSRDAAVASEQSFESAGKLKDTVRDLNGDGKDELIIWKELAKPGTWIPDADTPRRPAVYRLKGGKYVEDSRDFPNYYNGEVLPPLEKRIADLEIQAAAEVPSGSGGFSTQLAVANMEKDKILRVLGRNPAAGLNAAYRWMNSQNEQVLQCAIATFRDIGGHEEEVNESEASYARAVCRRQPGVVMCKDLGQQSGPAPIGESVYSGGGGSAPPPVVHHEVPPGRYAVPIHPDTPQ